MMAVAALTERGIEQKFKNLSYKELAKMLRLTPLEETISGQELLKDDRVKTLTRQVARKFSLSPEVVGTIQIELDTLDADILAQLLDQIIDIDTFERFQQRIAACQSLVSV